MRNCINRTHIEGWLYEHKLEAKVTGDNSKTPGTNYITGTIDIATDNAMTNIVTVHFSFVTATTASGKPNATYNVLTDIITGINKSVMKHGAENATMLRIDSAIGLNDFYTDRNGSLELVSAKRNEGGFVHVVTDLNEDEKTRNTFEVDIIITNVTLKEADEENGYPEKAIIKGAIFDFRKSLLPIELGVLNPNAINYFMGLEASQSNPVFTKLRGRQISEVTVREIKEESAFGDDYVRTVKNTRKDYIVTWALPDPYEWDTEGTITVAELQKAIADRETYLATVKANQEKYQASKNQAPSAFATTTQGGFKF